MNFLKRCARSILPTVSLSSQPSRHYTFYLSPITRCSPYSSKPTGTQKPEEPYSSSSWSKGLRKQAQSLANSPRPREIPYQAKVANLVKLIGHVKLPVKFQSFSNGKRYAATLISQEYGPHRACWIPVLFAGGLAHVATCHVKENDCVYVIGKLSADPMPFELHECQGNFHVLAQDINFVEGFSGKAKALEFFSKKNVKQAVGGDSSPDYADGDIDGGDVLSEKGHLVDGSMRDDGVDALSQKRDGASALNDRSSSEEIDDNVDHSQIDGSQRSSETPKEGQSGFELWEDLVNYPNQWLDCRGNNSKGLVSPKFPDFKHMKNGAGLWLISAPQWVLPRLENLDFGAFAKKQGLVKDRKEEMWKSLVENPKELWDNRLA